MSTAEHLQADNRLPELEDWLSANAITWRYEPALSLADIDHMTGLANQARLQPLDEHVVDRYQADMEAGAMFPPIVVRRHRRKHIPVGGNHRCAAARKAGVPHLAAYVLESITDEQVHLLAIEDNRRHGLPLTDDERLYHGVQLVNSGRHTTVDAARICGIPAHKLGRQLDANRGAQRAIRRDVDGWAALSTTSRAKCVSIQNDAVFARVVPLIANGTILAAEVQDLVARINEGTVEQATELIDALEADAGQRTRRSTGHPVSRTRAPATRLLHDLDGICSYEPAGVAADIHTPEQRTRLANQIKVAARRLMAIEKELWA